MDIKSVLLIVLVLLLHLRCNIHADDGDNRNDEETDFSKLVLNEEALKGSRWAVERNESIVVYNSIDIVGISKVDVNTMSIRLEFHLRQRWTADDLTFPECLFKSTDPENASIVADADVLKSVWSPNSYFPSARETSISKVSSEQSMVQIYRNLTIIFSSRVSTTLGCSFTFTWYPLDRQGCFLSIESYDQPITKVRYRWEPALMSPPVTCEPLRLFQYDLAFPLTTRTGKSTWFGRDATYSNIFLPLYFERRIGNYVIQVLIPTILCVVLSWFGFWLGLDAIPGRITLVITSMLTLVTLHSSQKRDLPPVNYIKMSDIWMVCCMAFVFAAFCEFIVVKSLHWNHQERVQQGQSERTISSQRVGLDNMVTSPRVHPAQRLFEPYIMFYDKNGENAIVRRQLPITEHEIQSTERNSLSSNGRDDFHRNRNRSHRKRRNKRGVSSASTSLWEKIDSLSRIAFPIIFLVYMVTFFSVLYIGAQRQQDFIDIDTVSDTD